MRYLVFGAAFIFIGGWALLTALYLSSNGLTFVGVVGLLLLIWVSIGVLGAFFHQTRR